LTDESQDTPQQDQCTIHVGGKRCTESADGASGLCFLHDPKLTLEDREEIAKGKGYASLKTYVEDKAKHKKLPWGVHLEGADLRDALLEDADLTAAHLEDADLFKAHLEGANLCFAHLEGANLINAHLEGAGLVEAHFEGADLRGAEFKGANLLGAHLEDADLAHAHLAETRGLSVAHLEQIVPSVEACRSFKRAFLEMSRYDDASNAAFREKRRQREVLERQTWESWSPRRLMGRAWLANFGQWLVHGALEVLCGYFEKPGRPVRWALVVVLLFGLIYYWGGGIEPSAVGGCAVRPTPSASQASEERATLRETIYFSAVTFTTLGYGDYRPRPGWREVAAIEAFTGAFLIAIFVVTLSHRFVAR